MLYSEYTLGRGGGSVYVLNNGSALRHGHELQVDGVGVRWGFNDLFNDGDEAAKLIREVIEAVNDTERKV